MQLVKNSLPFMEPKGSTCPQELVTGHYPDQMNPVHKFPTHFLQVSIRWIFWFYGIWFWRFKFSTT